MSGILDNILGLLLLEGSYDIQDSDNGFNVMIETPDAGRLIGFKGENLTSLQLLINQMMSRREPALSEATPKAGGVEGFKRVILDVSGWRKNKESELAEKATEWAGSVKESGQEMELEPMPSWQRRIIHMTVQEMDGVESESIGEGRDRHLVIRPSK
ncbi:MAG: spoIIIJ-associated protein [Microgenomates group bacterium Gr01-1014_80]|nr:MAG: spoIIIJ-associated protein [Microgenomates group bacterium Gr01-1014_80]